MKRRIIAALCALLTAFTLIVLPWSVQAASPYEGIYLVGVDDTVLLNLISSTVMPVRRAGVVYAPYTVLDNKELGVSYALNRQAGTFTIFDRKRTLIFLTNGGGAEDKEGNTYENRVFSRNGNIYIPLRFVASFFGWRYSFYNLVLSDGTVPIARLCTDRATYDDNQFGVSAAQLVAQPLRQYLASQATPTPTPTPTATPIPTPTPTPAPTPTPSPVASLPPAASPSPSATPSAAPSPTPEPQEPVTIFLAVSCPGTDSVTQAVEILKKYRVSALFLFDPAQLAQQDSQIREAAAAGHQIGLLLPSDGPEEAFDTGNRLLYHILHSETNQVAFPQGGEIEGNWWVWRGSDIPRGSTVSRRLDALLEWVNSQEVARVTVDNTSSALQTLERALEVWQSDPVYTILTPTENS